MDNPVQTASPANAMLAGEYIQRRYGVLVGGMHLLLPQGLSTELLHDQILTRILLAPQALRGVANVRGTLLPVFDLGKLIGTQASDDEQILMLGHHPEVLGLLVQGYPQPVSDLVIDDSAPVPDLFKPYVIHLWRQRDLHWIEVDILQLFRDLAAQKPYKE